MAKKLQIIGKRFGRLLVLREVEQVETNYGKVRRFMCKCDCGRRKVIRIDALKGSTKSCGCLNRENNIKKRNKHGKHDHPLYKRWDAMRQRCTNPNNTQYHCYGGRGIKMYDDWLHDFQSFYDWCIDNNYRPSCQLIRKDKNKGFYPDNLKFKSMSDHGLTKHPLYRKWDSIKQRCTNPNTDYYHLYGGRGIKMSKKWRNDFQSFYDWCIENGWNEGLQIDRIDNDGYTGISWAERDQKWVSRININGKVISLGNHKTKRAALDARNNYIVQNKLTKDYKIQHYTR